ncbi:MAG TPA: HAMP domain-containing sensor histidine kinase [Thermoleophilaceae bacterium]|jgi:two-component system sensor histidine kinase MprB
MIVASAAAVAVAVALAAAITYVVASQELHDQVDDSLRDRAGELAADRVLFFQAPAPPPERAKGVRRELREPPPAVLPAPGRTAEVAPVPAPDAGERLVLALPPLSGDVRYAQIVRADGGLIRPPRGRVELPGRGRALAIARLGSGSFFADARVGGEPVRVYTRAMGDGAALQVARPVGDVNDALRRLAYVLGAVSVGGIGLAAVLALFVARAALKPVARLSDAAEHVARTRDLSRRMDGAGSDELARLAESFNTMLEALERSMRQQRQLVADASHELRTPLTSLRTNIEVLAESRGMPEPDRRRLLADAVAQLEELTVLVGDLVDLARDEEELSEPFRDLRLDELVAGVVERARRRHPDRPFAVALEPTLVHGVAPRIDRAVSNLLDNAEKWSPPGQPIEVTVADGHVAVCDHGPGIAGEDLPFVFDRFYRAPSARAKPGSGLGLAIVRHVAETHGGVVAAEDAPDGGARLVMQLPSSEADGDGRPPGAPSRGKLLECGGD